MSVRARFNPATSQRQRARFPGGSSAAITDPGLALLQSAALWLDASDVIPGAQWIRNKGTGGRALDARVGSVGSAQIVRGVLKLPGTTGNTATATGLSQASLSNVDIMALVAPQDWTLTANAWGVQVARITGATRSFSLNFSALNDRLGFTISGVGDYTSNAAHALVDGAMTWIRATYQPSSGTLRFYTAPETADGSLPSTWTQLGTDVAAASGHSTGTVSSYGISPDATTWSGSARRVTVRNGFDGAGVTVFDADFAAVPELAASFVESSANAATVTINSTSGVDTNDPLPIPHAGVNFIHCQGAGGAVSTPHNTTLNGTATVDVRVAFLGLESGRNRFVATKGLTIAGNLTYRCWVTSANLMRFDVSDGTTLSGVDSPSVVPGTYLGTSVPVGLRYTFNAGTVEFFHKPVSPTTALADIKSNAGWVSLGTATAAVTTLFSSTTAYGWGGLHIVSASNTTDSLLAGSVSQLIGGTPLVSFTTNVANESALVTEQAQAVTITRAATGRKPVFVDRATILYGADDFLEVAHNALLDIDVGASLTALVVTRRHGAPTNQARILAKRTAAGLNPGWEIFMHNTAGEYVAYHDVGATASTFPTDVSQTVTLGNRHLVGGIWNRGTNLVRATIGSTVSSGVAMPAGDASNTAPLLVGRFDGGTNYNDFEVEHVAVFRSALTASELGQIATYLGV